MSKQKYVLNEETVDHFRGQAVDVLNMTYSAGEKALKKLLKRWGMHVKGMMLSERQEVVNSALKTHNRSPVFIRPQSFAVSEDTSDGQKDALDFMENEETIFKGESTLKPTPATSRKSPRKKGKGHEDTRAYRYEFTRDNVDNRTCLTTPIMINGMAVVTVALSPIIPQAMLIIENDQDGWAACYDIKDGRKYVLMVCGKVAATGSMRYLPKDNDFGYVDEFYSDILANPDLQTSFSSEGLLIHLYRAIGFTVNKVGSDVSSHRKDVSPPLGATVGATEDDGVCSSPYFLSSVLPSRETPTYMLNGLQVYELSIMGEKAILLVESSFDSVSASQNLGRRSYFLLSFPGAIASSGLFFCSPNGELCFEEPIFGRPDFFNAKLIKGHGRCDERPTEGTILELIRNALKQQQQKAPRTLLKK